jgi:hypothetical protein
MHVLLTFKRLAQPVWPYVLAIMLFCSALQPLLGQNPLRNYTRKQTKSAKMFLSRGVKIGTDQEANQIKTEIRHLFTFHRKECKIISVHCGVAVGQVLQTPALGKVIVIDHILGTKKVQFYKLTKPNKTKIKLNTNEQPEKKLFTKKIRSIKQLVVLADENYTGEETQEQVQVQVQDQTLETPEPKLKKVKLSPEQTKELMIEQLVKRNQLKTLVRMYPEERENIPELVKRYNLDQPQQIEEDPLVVP